MRQTPRHSPPRYCEIDGETLMHAVFSTQIHHFDPFTGRPFPVEMHPQLMCPHDGHDVWRLYDHLWVKVQP